jgi:erythronate-4-phosphate dehydrogenase
MNILYEDSMPYAQHYFAKLGNLQSYSSQQITADDLHNVDVLLVRSTTKVNEALLHSASRLRFVATATAGSDHLDKDYLHSRSIPWSSAAGCNAIAVAEYVLSCLMVKFADDLPQLKQLTVGIVGAGHVGSALNERLGILGIKTKLCDPPLEKTGDPRDFVSIDEICRCDVISLHVPYISSGEFATLHMFDSERLSRLKQHQILINACRGEVIDNQAALRRMQQPAPPVLMIDVWENEPSIDFNLLPFTDVATAHIAGHSLEGKARGTFMLYQQLCAFMGIEENLNFTSCLPMAAQLNLNQFENGSELEQVRDAILATYNVRQDTERFKQQVKTGQDFVYSRKHYAIRREFASIPLNTGNSVPFEALYRLGFGSVKD